MARSKVRVDAFTRARWYLSRGYKQAEVAGKLGVHRNTVNRWAVELDADRESRTVRNILRRFRRLSDTGRSRLLQELQKCV